MVGGTGLGVPVAGVTLANLLSLQWANQTLDSGCPCPDGAHSSHGTVKPSVERLFPLVLTTAPFLKVRLRVITVSW